MNDTWGYKKYDDNWKSTEELLYLLVDLASKGVNYLLNIGPTAKGEIPEPSIKRLKDIGSWMDDNGKAIYGTEASPFSYEFDWGRITQKPGKLYFLFTEWPEAEFEIYGIKNKIKNAKLLKDGTDIKFEQLYEDNSEQNVLKLNLDQTAPDAIISVIEVDIEGEADVDDSPKQRPNNSIVLPAHLGQIHGDEIKISRGGYTNWHNTDDWIEWEFKIFKPGTFKVKVQTTSRANRKWVGGHEINIEIGDKVLSGKIEVEEEVNNPRNLHATEMAHYLGEVNIVEKGFNEIRLEADVINEDSPLGLAVTQVTLIPVE
jgi:alpha-L-fucosidase